MSPTAARRAALIATLCVAGPTELRAQSLSASGVRNLGFGDVLPGVPITVSPTDAVRSGQFDIVGPVSADVEITFLLPTALEGPPGSIMPISFSSTSAGFSPSGSITSQILFDPRIPFRVTLSALGRGSGFLGGSLTPSGTQPPGSYGASVSITIALVGL